MSRKTQRDFLKKQGYSLIDKGESIRRALGVVTGVDDGNGKIVDNSTLPWAVVKGYDLVVLFFPHNRDRGTEKIGEHYRYEVYARPTATARIVDKGLKLLVDARSSVRGRS